MSNGDISNGEKNGSGKFWKCMGVFIAIFVVIVGSVFTYATTTTALSASIKANALRISDSEKALNKIVFVTERVEGAVQRQNEGMIELRGDVKLIRMAVEKMEKNGSR